MVFNVTVPFSSDFSTTGPSSGPAELPLIAGVLFPSGFRIDPLLARVAERLQAEGHAIGGVLQSNAEKGECLERNVRLHSLKHGWDIPLLEKRGQFARGCRMNPQAIADVAGRLEAEFETDAALFIINRFGRSEAEGYGLRSVLQKAVLTETPVLIGVRADYEGAFKEFHQGLGCSLDPDEEVLLTWCHAHLVQAAR